MKVRNKKTAIGRMVFYCLMFGILTGIPSCNKAKEVITPVQSGDGSGGNKPPEFPGGGGPT